MGRSFVALLLCSFAAPAWAGDAPASALSGAKIDARVVADGAPDVRRFEYRVTHAGAERRIDGLAIDIGSDPGRERLSGEGLDFVAPSFDPARELRRWYGDRAFYVPVGVAAQPDGWVNGVSAPARLTWGALRTTARLEPGGAAVEFVATSRGLPGLRDAELVPEVADDESADPAAVAARLEAASQKLRTVGPVAPPKPFDPAAFANYVAALRAECATQGWIRAGSDTAELDRLLTEVRDRLAARAPGDATESADAFIAAVERASCVDFDCPEDRALTAEARALLAGNMRFLRERMPAPAPSAP
jgi:hypothetical protein